MRTAIQNAHHYLNEVERMECSGLYNQSQTELYVAVRYAQHFFPALQVRYSYGEKLWILETPTGWGNDRLLGSPVLMDVVTYLRKILPKEIGDGKSDQENV